MVSIGDQLMLKRNDLLTFPKETVDLILKMQKEGWRGHVNRQGHVKMLAPDGETFVMATQNPNSPTYVRSGYNQYQKKQGKTGGEEVNAVLPKGAQKWPCARPGCPKVYASEQQLNDHIAVEHEGLLLCPEKDCHETFKRPAALGLHRANKHGYVSPTKAKRKAQEAKRAAKKVLDEVIEEVDKGDIADGSEKGIVTSESKFDTPTEFTPVAAESPEEVVALAAETIVEWDSKKQGPRPNWLVDAKGGVHDVVEAQDAVTEIEPTPIVQRNYVAKGLSASDIYRQTAAQLNAAKSEEVVRTDKDIEFLDTRDSWVVDDPELMSMSVNSIKKILNAVGLEVEIRVWRKKD